MKRPSEMRPCGYEEVVAKLRHADELQAEGATITDSALSFGVSEVTVHRWRAEYSAVERDPGQWLKELETKNSRLKRLVAEQQMDIHNLNEVAKGEH